MSGIRRVDGFELTTDGVAVRTMRWPPVEPSWATLLLVHGLGEHAVDDTIAWLREHASSRGAVTPR